MSGWTRITACLLGLIGQSQAFTASPFSPLHTVIPRCPPSRQRVNLVVCSQTNDHTDPSPDSDAFRHPKSRKDARFPSEQNSIPPNNVVDQATTNSTFETALQRTMFWVGAAIAFDVGLLVLQGPNTAQEFLAGYLLEQSLSVDNLLVFLLLFDYFNVPPKLQTRVLNWGIIGAIGMRAIMIGAGVVAIQKFQAVLLLFAGILIYTSAKLLWDTEPEGQNLSAVTLANRFIPSTTQFDGDKFFTQVDGVQLATPLFLCMVAVEISDVVFAIDSIPAVFGVTQNPLVVFSSNLFAILGLRSMYTVLSKAASELEYLEPAVAVVLGLVGIKMVAEYEGFHVPTELSLVVVASILGGGILASLYYQDDVRVATKQGGDS